jgi:hypothetical protein
MAVAPVRDQVNDDVLVELVAVVERELGDEQHRFGIVSVYVEDGRVYHFGDIGAVQRGARVELVAGGETDLIVHHDMYGAARRIPARLR